jgi:hypothetical protein
MKDFKEILTQYSKWCEQQDWFRRTNQQAVDIQPPPTHTEISKLEKKFGKLPQSYLSTLASFGLSSYIYDAYLTKMLAPKEIIECYEIVQNEMDFNDGVRELLLEEDQLDFSNHIPVMAGKGHDGRWVLLNMENGKILYWDTDQSAYCDDMYENLEAFILDSIDRAKHNNPMRLT